MAAVDALQLNIMDKQVMSPAAAPACEGLAPEPEPAEPSVEPSAAEPKGTALAEVETPPSTNNGAEGSEGDTKHQEVHQAAPVVPTKKVVHFASVEITAMWVADSVLDYNRRSIVVDLSKTPFALFRRDAVMMKQARTTIDPSAPLPPPGPPALRSEQDSPPVHGGRTSASASTADTDASPSSSPSPPHSSLRRRRPSDKLFRVWDSESSESSEGHTDWETDDTETDWHSDAESVCSSNGITETPSSSSSSSCLVDQQLRRGSNSESGPAFYGVWKRTSSEGYEELLLKSGVPKRAVALAVAKHPVHIIDHDGSYFRLIVKNGLSKVDNTFFIGDEPKQVRASRERKTRNRRRHVQTSTGYYREKFREAVTLPSVLLL